MAKADVAKAAKQDGETEESRTKREGVKGPQDAVPDTPAHGAAVGSGWTSPKAEKVVAEPEKAPSVDVGAAEHVRPLLNHLAAITDVTALATVREAVAARCQACGVEEKKA